MINTNKKKNNTSEEINLKKYSNWKSPQFHIFSLHVQLSQL